MDGNCRLGGNVRYGSCSHLRHRSRTGHRWKMKSARGLSREYNSRFLDVNVPMYAAGKPNTFKEACVWILTQFAEGGQKSALDTEIIQEILYRYGALQEWEVATTMTTDLLELVSVTHPVTPADIKLTATLFQRYALKGVRARDLIHVAVMHNNGLTRIVPTNAHFEQIPGITRLDPVKLYAERDS